MVRTCCAVALAAALGAAPAAPAPVQSRPLEALGLVHRSWDVADGLPQATVTGLAQTPDGYLLVSTFGGLARFDGLEFHPVGADERLPPRISGLQTGGDGAIWVLPETGGLWRRDPVTGAIEEVPELRPYIVRSAISDAAGALWAGTARDGLFHLEDGRVTRLTAADGLAANAVVSLALGRPGEVWVGTDAGLSRVCAGRVCPVANIARPGSRVITRILVRKDGAVVTGSPDGTVCTLQEGRGDCLGLIDPSGPAYVSALIEAPEGEIWAGTTVGLFRLARGGVLKITDRDGLSDINVGSETLDGDGNLWVGTNAGGLNLLRKSPFAVIGREKGLRSEQILAVTVDRDGAPLVALNCGSVSRIAGGGAEELVPGNRNLVACGWSLLRARDGALWVGTWGDGLLRFKDGESRWITNRDGLTDMVVLSLFERRSGEVWAGTRGGGACRVTEARPVCLTMRDGLPSDDVRYLAETPDGALWLATSGGLSRWDGSALHNLTTADGLASPLTRALHVDSTGALWVGTYGGGLGLVRDGRVLSVTSRSGLLDDVVSWIGEDGDGAFWLTGNRGVFRIRRSELLAVAEGRLERLFPSAFGVEDGMRSQECTGGFQPSGARTPDGRLWFPTIRGLVSVDPRALPRRAPRRAVVEGIRVDGQPLPAAAAVFLPRSFRTLEIRYGGLDLAAARKLIFRYQLAGVDRDWVDAGSRRAAYYGNLRTGRYRFAVQAFSPAGGWGPPSPGLEVEVPQVIWQQWWFLAACFAFLAGAIFSLGVARQKVRQRHEREHVEIARRLTAGILHEFRQPLQVLRTRLEILSLRHARGGDGGVGDDLTRALDRLDALLARLDSLQTVSGMPVRRYGRDESMADLEDRQGER